MIAILEKSEHNIDFHQIVDFVEASHIRYALTINPTVYVSHIRQFWSTARIETMNEGTNILATVDGKPRTISESSIRRNLKINDEEGISSLPDVELFENLALMGYNILPNQKFTFQKGRATWIAQSKAFPTVADEPASLLRDDSQGEAFPTVSGLDAGRDTENIIKTSALPHDSTPRVTSLDADEGMAKEMEEEIVRDNQRMNEQIARDAEIARIHAEEELKMMIDGLDRNNEVIARHLQEVKRKGLKLEQGSAIKMKTSKEVSEEDLKEMLQLVPVEEALVKETLSIRQASRDQQMELWVKQKRLFESDFEDQLWTHTQNLMHDPLD
nr:hypothetical protein [Tanacetum cinerariifolium]